MSYVITERVSQICEQRQFGSILSLIPVFSACGHLSVHMRYEETIYIHNSHTKGQMDDQCSVWMIYIYRRESRPQDYVTHYTNTIATPLFSGNDTRTLISCHIDSNVMINEREQPSKSHMHTYIYTWWCDTCRLK